MRAQQRLDDRRDGSHDAIVLLERVRELLVVVLKFALLQQHHLRRLGHLHSDALQPLRLADQLNNFARHALISASFAASSSEKPKPSMARFYSPRHLARQQTSSCKVAKRQAVWCCCKEPEEHNPSFLHEVGSEHSKEGGGLALASPCLLWWLLPLVLVGNLTTRRFTALASIALSTTLVEPQASAHSPQPSALIGHRRNSSIVVDVTKYLYR